MQIYGQFFGDQSIMVAVPNRPPQRSVLLMHGFLVFSVLLMHAWNPTARCWFKNHCTTSKTGWNCDPRLAMNPTMHWHMISYDVRSSCIHTSWMVWSWVTYLHFLLHSHTPKSIFVHVWWIYILHTSIKINWQSAQIIQINFMWSTTPLFIALSEGRILCGREVIHHLSERPIPSFQGFEFLSSPTPVPWW